MVPGATVLAALVGVGVAAATVTSVLLHDTHPAGGGPNEVRLRMARFEFVPSPDQPQFSSGWHTHPGPVIVQVQEGRLVLTQAPSCRPNIVGPGETYIETPEIPLIATARRPAKWTNSFIAPASKPLTTPVAGDPCASSEEDD